MKKTIAFFLRLTGAAILLGFRLSWLLLTIRWHRWRAARTFKRALLTRDVPEDVAMALAQEYKSTLRLRDLLQLRQVLRPPPRGHQEAQAQR